MNFTLSSLRTSVAGLGLLLTAAATSAHAQTVITSLPYTINTSGTYVLAANLNGTVTTGALITVNASNVTLDMKEFYISGPVSGSGNLTGVSANEQANVTVKNGTIAFCATGVDIEGSGNADSNAVNAQIENVRVTYCYFSGVIVNDVPASRIRRCQISQIGVNSIANNRLGINLGGPGITVQDNTISDIVASSSGSGNTYGIGADTGDFVFQNQISGAHIGIAGGIYQDNLLHATTTPVQSGTDGGGNINDNTGTTSAVNSVRSGDVVGKVHTGHKANN